MNRSALLAGLLGALLAAAPTAAADFTGPPDFIESGGADVHPEALVANDRGDRVVVYSTAAGTLRVAFAPAGGAFGEPQDVPESNRASEVQAAIGPSGDALIAWGYFDGTAVAENTDFDLQCCIGRKAALLPRGGPIGATATPWPRGTEVELSRIAIRDRASFGIVARTSRLESVEAESFSPLVLEGRFATRRGAWGPTETISATAGWPRALTITDSAARVLVESGQTLVEQVRGRAARWSRPRRLINRFGREFGVRTDDRGGTIVTWTQSDRRGAILRAGAGGPGERPRMRTVDRASRRSYDFGAYFSTAPNGTALLAWRFGEQWYRAERRAGRSFSGRRLAFAQGGESTPYSFAVNSGRRWVAGIKAGRDTEDDPGRLRAITATFGERASPSQLVLYTNGRDPLLALPPVIDRTGLVTFVRAGGGAIAAHTGR